MVKRAKTKELWQIKYWYGRDHTNYDHAIVVPAGRTLSGVLREHGIQHVYSTKRLKRYRPHYT